MSLDVDTPDPPELQTGADVDSYEDADVGGDDYRRAELEELLADGAWADGFQEWTDGTDVDDDEWAKIGRAHV